MSFIKKFKKIVEIIKENDQDVVETQQTSKDSPKQSFKPQPKYFTATQLGNKFELPATDINKILQTLNWQEKQGKWWIATDLGRNNGAFEKYDTKTKTKYVIWSIAIAYNPRFKEAIESFKNPKPKLTSKQKGDLYEQFIANYYREQGCTVWEHGKEKGVKDSSIDLIVKKQKDILFVQCKNWESWKINHKEVKSARMDAREYMKSNPLFTKLLQDYNLKLHYVSSKECLTKGAYKYIEENSNIISYEVIPIEDYEG
ncbi:MAG: restriction endonuclease [Campylobacterales bacterium]|nr:restriction endonuclease [Campylobacterales bacterium]